MVSEAFQPVIQRRVSVPIALAPPAAAGNELRPVVPGQVLASLPRELRVLTRGEATLLAAATSPDARALTVSRFAGQLFSASLRKATVRVFFSQSCCYVTPSSTCFGRGASRLSAIDRLPARGKAAIRHLLYCP